MGLKNKIESAFSAFSGIGNTTSLKEKQEILIKERDNEVVKTLLFSTYNPFIQYNIKRIPKVIPTNNPDTERNYSEFLGLLVKLSKREVTGNLAIDTLKRFLEGCSLEELYWYSKVIQKDLKIGLAEKGINKVYGDLIPLYEVMLAEKLELKDLSESTPKALKTLPDTFVCQYKIDGYRMNIHNKKDGHVEFRTRNGKMIYGYTALEKEVKEKFPKGYVYDGEIVAPELFRWIQENEENRKSGEVIANRELFSEAMSYAFRKSENKRGIFNIFDMVKEEEWVSGNSKEPLRERNKRLENLFSKLALKESVVVPTSRVYVKNDPCDLEEVMKLFHHFLEIGWEGLMIKDWECPYEFKRSKSLLKVKMMDTLDLTVVDMFEGEGKYKGAMGGVYVDYKGNLVGVGSGWSDNQRIHFWKNKNEILGKTIEVSYQSESKNKKGEVSLSFPVVKSIREDK